VKLVVEKQTKFWNGTLLDGILCSNGVHLFGTLEAAGDGAVHLNGLELPHSDNVVGVTGEEGQTISRPGEGDALWWGGWLAVLVVGNLNLQLLDELLLFQIPDSDGWAASGAKPVSVWTEDEGADFVGALQTVEWVVCALAQVPEHSLTVLSATSGQRSIWRDGNGVNVSGMTAKVVLEAKVAQVPDLQGLVPRARNDDWVLGGWRELNRAHPLAVAVLALLAPLELAQSVPELDGLVSAGGDDLSVIGGEGNGEYVVLVAGESGGGDTSFEVPESEGLIPRSGDGELTARADNDVRDEVVVSLQSLHWVTVHITVSVEVPDDEGLVSGGGDEHIWELWVGSNLSYPATVALEGTLQGHNFLASHNFFVCFFSVSVSST
jgi:hypothetical protein